MGRDGLVSSRRITWWVCVKKRGPWQLCGDRLGEKRLERGRPGSGHCLVLAQKRAAKPGAVQWRWGSRPGPRRLEEGVTRTGLVADVCVR